MLEESYLWDQDQPKVQNRDALDTAEIMDKEANRLEELKNHLMSLKTKSSGLS